ncbi:hypothetical protein DSO57_1034633 [Entomophthora muscae]|uniref:Uncharacterized protein n=1 Tax=Entomophthora muscae TaxID=34485 RepID=A0ACC2ULD6_9FUNG|nr:hypothetical protein DSO57_1034633 [Entomophthora muscae]
MPAFAAELPLDHTNKLFEIVYITLTGTVIRGGQINDLPHQVSTNSLVGPARNRQGPEAGKPAAQGWFPDKLVLFLTFL